MKRLDRNDTRGLRHFGLLLAAAFPIVFGLLLPWLFSHGRPLWPLAVGAVSGAAALAAPRALHPVYVGWMRVALVLGWINTRLLLGLVFFGMMLPLGRVLRALGKLQYTEAFDTDRDSYRIVRRRPPSATDLENPF